MTRISVKLKWADCLLPDVEDSAKLGTMFFSPHLCIHCQPNPDHDLTMQSSGGCRDRVTSTPPSFLNPQDWLSSFLVIFKGFFTSLPMPWLNVSSETMAHIHKLHTLRALYEKCRILLRRCNSVITNIFFFLVNVPSVTFWDASHWLSYVGVIVDGNTSALRLIYG